MGLPGQEICDLCSEYMSCKICTVLQDLKKSISSFLIFETFNALQIINEIKRLIACQKEHKTQDD